MGSEINVIIKENETMKIGHSSHDWYKGYNWKTLTNDGQCNKCYDWWEVKYNIIKKDSRNIWAKHGCSEIKNYNWKTIKMRSEIEYYNRKTPIKIRLPYWQCWNKGYNWNTLNKGSAINIITDGKWNKVL